MKRVIKKDNLEKQVLLSILEEKNLSPLLTIEDINSKVQYFSKNIIEYEDVIEDITETLESTKEAIQRYKEIEREIEIEVYNQQLGQRDDFKSILHQTLDYDKILETVLFKLGLEFVEITTYKEFKESQKKLEGYKQESLNLIKELKEYIDYFYENSQVYDSILPELKRRIKIEKYAQLNPHIQKNNIFHV